MTPTTDLAAQIARRNAARRDLMTTYRGKTIAIATNPLTQLPEIVYPESELGGAQPSLYTWHAPSNSYMSIPA